LIVRRWACALCVLVPALGAAQDTAATSSPLSTAFSYTGVLQSNVAGGGRRGTAFSGAAAVQLALALDRVVSWPGAQLYVFLLDTDGGAPTDFVGALQAVSAIEAPPALRDEELWLQQNAISGRVSVLVGRYDVNSEFYRIQSGALFVHSSFGIGPEFSQSGVRGPSTFPFTAVGLRAAVKPLANLVLRAGIFNGAPVDRPGGEVRVFASGDGALIVGEVASLDRADTPNVPRDRRFQIGRGMVRPYDRKIAVGVWHYTASFPDIADTVPGGTAVMHPGSTGAYLIADQSLWRRGGDGPRLLAGFAQLGIGDSRLNRVGRYIGGGLTLADPLTRRAQDQVGIAAAIAFVGSHYKRTLGSAARAAAEATIELTYLAQIKPWLAAQPDLQYVIAPGGARSTRNAVIPGFRVALTR
jgi:porin